MRTPVFAIALIASGAGAFGYEQGMPSLEVPYSMEPGKLELTIQHRFVGKAFEDVFDSFFGADLGANVLFGCRYFLPAGFELGASHQRAGGEYSLGAGYNRQFAGFPAGLRFGASIFTIEQPLPDDPDNRDSGFFGSAAVEAGPFADRLSLAANVGYDGNAGRTCLGFGLDGAVTERLSLVGEYSPAMSGDEDHPALDNDCWTAGVRLDTWGHQFCVVLSNTTSIGLRSIAGGIYPVDDMVRLGFSVRRQLSL
jgi:hypothetical protein